MDKKKFIGTWKLKSIELYESNGDVSYPLGKDAVGLLMYQESGFMTVVITRSQRLSEAILTVSPDQLKEALLGFSAYYATYRVNEEDKIITHFIQEGSPFLHFVNTPQQRAYEFSGNRLILKSDVSDQRQRQYVRAKFHI